MHTGIFYVLCTLSSSCNPVAQAPLNIKAVRDGPTSILVSWGNPSHSEDTNGYYSSGGSNASVTIYEVDTEYTLSNLLNGEIYSFFRSSQCIAFHCFKSFFCCPRTTFNAFASII